MAEFLHETLLQFVLLYEADDVAHHRAEGLLLYTHLLLYTPLLPLYHIF